MSFKSLVNEINTIVKKHNPFTSSPFSSSSNTPAPTPTRSRENSINNEVISSEERYRILEEMLLDAGFFNNQPVYNEIKIVPIKK